MDFLSAADTSLDAARLNRCLVDSGPYSRIVHVESIGSTNQFLVQAAAEPGFSQDWPHLSVLTAEEQTSGKGRRGRGWSSPRATTLSSSIVLRPRLSQQDWSWISLIAGMSLVEVLCGEAYGLPASLKWPNDVHVEGRKISGILSAVAGEAVVLGVGVNVLLTESELPTPTSTSVAVELQRAGRQPAEDLRTELLTAFLARFAGHLQRTECDSSAQAIPDLRDRVAAVMDTVGQQVRVELPDGSARRGMATALESSGSLAVEVDGWRPDSDSPWQAQPAERSVFSAGDVIHLRRTES